MQPFSGYDMMSFHLKYYTITTRQQHTVDKDKIIVITREDKSSKTNKYIQLPYLLIDVLSTLNVLVCKKNLKKSLHCLRTYLSSGSD